MDKALRAAKRAQEKLEAASETRDAAVVAAVDAGASLRAVGAATGLSHVGVMKLTQRYRG